MDISRCQKHLESVYALMLIHVLSQRSTTTPLASKRDMVLMGLLTRQLAEIFLEPDGTSSVHASGFQPVSGASVQRLNRASCAKPKTGWALVRRSCHRREDHVM